jgi:hypothetical protein
VSARHPGDLKPADRNDDPTREPLDQPAPQAPTCVFCSKPADPARDGGVCARCSVLMSQLGWST